MKKIKILPRRCGKTRWLIDMFLDSVFSGQCVLFLVPNAGMKRLTIEKIKHGLVGKFGVIENINDYTFKNMFNVGVGDVFGSYQLFNIHEKDELRKYDTLVIDEFLLFSQVQRNNTYNIYKNGNFSDVFIATTSDRIYNSSQLNIIKKLKKAEIGQWNLSIIFKDSRYKEGVEELWNNFITEPDFTIIDNNTCDLKRILTPDQWETQIEGKWKE